MKVQVALKLGSLSNAQVLVKCEHYISCMTDNPYFTAPEIVAHIATCKTSVTNLHGALNLPISDNKTDKIKIARDVLDRNFTILGSQVELVANDPSIPDTARADIVHSAGMELKEQVHPGPHKFTATNTKVSGKVRLTAQGKANAHEWEYTTDTINFTGRISIPPETLATIYIENLKRATEYAFFHRSVKPGKDTDWEGPILLVVM